MAYNKTKHIESAQKFLHQGKTAQAIAEYQAILKHEPRDQITLMTIGDLYVRQGETFQALEYFERLAQIFLSDGFITKAIAIYKKIAKLAPEENRPVERLAELYIQQGVLSEARPIYLQLAEMHQRAGRQPQAAALLRKLLDAEPENLRVLTQLAELSTTMGQPAEAAAAYRSAAEQLQRRGDNAEAIKYADRALQIEPNDEATASLKAQALAGVGKPQDAVTLLKSLPQIEAGGKASNQLLDLYFEAGDRSSASELSNKIFARNPKHFAAAHRVADSLLEAGEADRALAILDMIREAMTDAGEHEALSQSLLRAAERLPSQIEPREWLVELYGRTSDSFRMSDALADLAAVCEKAGKHDRARQAYEQMLDRDPENETAHRKHEQVRARLGLSGGIPETEPTQTPDAAAQAAGQTPAQSVPKFVEPPLDNETQQFVTQSLTDVDLFSSYGLTQKAIDLLEVVLQRAPRHTASIERLLDLYLGAGNERRTAELASQLQQIYTERDDPAAADRFAQLRRGYERAAGITPAQAEAASPAPPPDFSVPVVEAAPIEETEDVRVPSVAATPQNSADDLGTEPEVHEVDLSEEWAALAGILNAEPRPASTSSAQEFSVASPLEQIDPEEASRVEAHEEPASVLVSAPESPALQETSMQGAGMQAETMQVPPMQEAAALSETEQMQIPPMPEIETVPPAEEDAVWKKPGEIIGADSPDYDLELEPISEENGASASSMDAESFLRSLASDLDAVLPTLAAAQPAPTETSHAGSVERAPLMEANMAHENGAQSSSSQNSGSGAGQVSGPLSDVFAEFRADMGEDSAEDEDLETHYNLGIAYREMGLLEEAISEFQKVAKANQQGQAFRYAMQCCTLLGLAFMEKGQPGIAAMWYERAIETRGLDQESILALRYDLGVAQELAGETSAARKSFSQVYGMNIDYRDVAERLGALGKGS